MRIALTKDMVAVRASAKAIIDATFMQPIDAKPVHALKEAEARRHKAGDSSSYLEQEASVRGVDADQLASTIIRKAEAVRTKSIFSNELQRQKLWFAVCQAKTRIEVDAILAEQLPETILQIEDELWR